MARAAHEARLLVAREGLVVPASAFRVHRLSAMGEDTVDLGGATIRAPALAALTGRVTCVAAAACTLGPALEARVSALFADRQPLLAMALDSLGSEMLFKLSDRLHARIKREARRCGLQVGPPQNPGDPGVGIEAQPTVRALAGIGPDAVSADPGGMLRPVKSLTFLVALGEELPAQPLAPRCIHCPSRDRCTVRPQ